MSDQLIRVLAHHYYVPDNVPKRALLSLSAGLGAFLVLIGIIMLASLVFWLMMVVHAAKNDIEDKPLWILVLLVSLVSGLWLVGGLVYYFAIKKKVDTKKPPTPKSTSKSSKKS